MNFTFHDAIALLCLLFINKGLDTLRIWLIMYGLDFGTLNRLMGWVQPLPPRPKWAYWASRPNFFYRLLFCSSFWPTSCILDLLWIHPLPLSRFVLVRFEAKTTPNCKIQKKNPIYNWIKPLIYLKSNWNRTAYA